MGDGKRGVAPCGHEGEHLIANYVKCLQGCDAVGDFDDDEITLEILVCKCGSINIEEDFQVDPMYYMFNPLAKIVDTRCFDCGRVWAK